ncbi:uncharacterized protein LOC129146108 [Talpa occidentalis]|uniref:uncharacterized protein LOC129146108 n=1 Tax=Talpa occidentalis TaxID=50954 RepID=UPI0023F682F8|nr:uncharacterized protein LOC129146108 [Talpa occidentalis]
MQTRWHRGDRVTWLKLSGPVRDSGSSWLLFLTLLVTCPAPAFCCVLVHLPWLGDLALQLLPSSLPHVIPSCSSPPRKVLLLLSPLEAPAGPEPEHSQAPLLCPQQQVRPGELFFPPDFLFSAPLLLWVQACPQSLPGAWARVPRGSLHLAFPSSLACGLVPGVCQHPFRSVRGFLLLEKRVQLLPCSRRGPGPTFLQWFFFFFFFNCFRITLSPSLGAFRGLPFLSEPCVFCLQASLLCSLLGNLGLPSGPNLQRTRTVFFLIYVSFSSSSHIPFLQLLREIEPPEGASCSSLCLLPQTHARLPVGTGFYLRVCAVLPRADRDLCYQTCGCPWEYEWCRQERGHLT